VWLCNWVLWLVRSLEEHRGLGIVTCLFLWGKDGRQTPGQAKGLIEQVLDWSGQVHGTCLRGAIGPSRLSFQCKTRSVEWHKQQSGGVDLKKNLAKTWSCNAPIFRSEEVSEPFGPIAFLVVFSS
jgi:hypothetical protein